MKVPTYVYGNISPVFTAFNEDMTLDDDGQRNMLDFLVNEGSVSAFFVRSGLGQMFALNMEDAKQLVSTACKHLGNRMPVLMGCNGDWDRNRNAGYPDPGTYLAQAIELSKFSQDAGAAGVVHSIPEAIRPLDGGSVESILIQYFEAVNDSVSIPVFIYQTPGTEKDYMVTPDRLARIAGLENVVGIKVSYSDAYYIYQLVRAVADKDFGYITGAETAYYAALHAGSKAVIGQGSSVNPKITLAIQKAYEAGDRDAVLAAQDAVNELVEACQNPVDFLKRYATQRGFPVKPHFRELADNPYVTSRAPLTDNEYETFKTLRAKRLAQF